MRNGTWVCQENAPILRTRTWRLPVTGQGELRSLGGELIRSRLRERQFLLPHVLGGQSEAQHPLTAVWQRRAVDVRA